MELYKNPQAFADAVISTSDHYHVSPAIVEKDYFVTIILRRLNEEVPGILFRGGTCLSKCFGIIDRFSEDIDLTLDTSHFMQSNKRNANKSVISVCDDLGFPIQNRKEVELHTHGNYNCYIIEYPISFSNSGISPFVKLEMTFIQKSYPDTVRPVSSMIGDFLTDIGSNNSLSEFSLIPFEMTVQSLERTFVDKVFALCDYYLADDSVRQSRHIYDLHQLMNVIDWKSLNNLVSSVRNERAANKRCLSAQENVSVKDVLVNICDTDYFRNDYEEVTENLLTKKISYDDAIKSIREISSDSLFK